MSRGVRITVGAVLAGVLALVAVVAAVVALAGGPDDWSFEETLGPGPLDSAASAEVLDVDDDWEWATVDVRWTTGDGEVVVTSVDWEWSDDLPAVGDRVDVVFDEHDPEYAYAAEDPWVALEVTGSGDGSTEGDEAVAGAEGAPRAARWVALAALAGVVVTAVVTVVAAVRAPPPPPRDGRSWGGHDGTDPYAPRPGAQSYQAHTSYPQPQPYPQRQPYPPQPSSPPPPSPGSWSSP